MSTVLTLEDTVSMSQVSHRLALGVQWRDAVSHYPMTLSAPADLVTDLEAVGQRPCPQRLDAHGEGRHAIRHSGPFAKILARAVIQPEVVNDGNPANDPDGLLLSLRVFARRHRTVVAYQSGNDPRVFVPRRLAFMPVLSGGVPPATTDNIRQAWLWPGAAYPLPSRATALRGRIQRKPVVGAAVPVPWARVVLTRPGAGAPNFDAEAKLGHAHGDDRGEFLLVLSAAAMPGGVTLPKQIDVHVWVFLPPAATIFDTSQPLNSLPLERAGVAAIDDVLRGLLPPATYIRQAAIKQTIVLGRAQSVGDAALTFT